MDPRILIISIFCIGLLFVGAIAISALDRADRALSLLSGFDKVNPYALRLLHARLKEIEEEECQKEKRNNSEKYTQQ